MKKSVAKRIKITREGKMIRRKMAIGHLGSKKTGGQKRLKKKWSPVAKSNLKSIKRYAAR